MFKNIVIIGAGQMGSGIGLYCAQQGATVTLCDKLQVQLDNAAEYFHKTLLNGVKKQRLSSEVMEATLTRLLFANDINSLDHSKVDLVIEAASEVEEVKVSIFQELTKVFPEKCCIATNTSSLSINRLSQSVTNPARFLGIHFMNPAYVIPLVETIPSNHTDKNLLNQIESWLSSINKTVVRSADHPGFIVNRILIPMINEAISALADNVAKTEDIDRAMTLGASFPMGPLRLADTIGLDVCLAIMQTLHQELKHADDPHNRKYQPHPLLIDYVTKKRYGFKVGRGFYDYSSGKPIAPDTHT